MEIPAPFLRLAAVPLIAAGLAGAVPALALARGLGAGCAAGQARQLADTDACNRQRRYRFHRRPAARANGAGSRVHPATR